MVFSKEDKILIKNLRESKGYSARKFIKEFPDKNWNRKGLDYLLKKLRETGTVERKVGSGRRRSARTTQNIDAVEDLIVSQEDKPRTHRSTRQIARETGVSQSSVVRIVNKDLSLKCFKRRRAQELTESNRLARLVRSRQLLKRYQEHDVAFMWYTDEKIFTVAAPSNSQNDRVYAARDTLKKQIAAKRLLRTRNTFSQSIMVSVGVSKLGCTELFFVDPGTKINGAYYRDILLRQKLLPAIRRVSGKNFIFQQDSAPAHRARETVEVLRRETPDFISPDLWPPNSPDLNPVDYEIWAVMQRRVYQRKIHTIDELKQRLIEVWCGLEQSTVDMAIDQWRKRLRACVRAKGGHFEHSL